MLSDTKTGQFKILEIHSGVTHKYKNTTYSAEFTFLQS